MSSLKHCVTTAHSLEDGRSVFKLTFTQGHVKECPPYLRTVQMYACNLSLSHTHTHKLVSKA